MNSSITNPLAINSFIGAAVGNLTIDGTLTQGDLLHIADVFRGLASHLVTGPCRRWPTPLGGSGRPEGSPALRPERDQRQFNAIGSTPTTTTTTTPKGNKATTTTTTTAPREPAGQVSVDVLNASSVNGIAHTAAAALTAQGFQVNEIGDASTHSAGRPARNPLRAVGHRSRQHAGFRSRAGQPGAGRQPDGLDGRVVAGRHGADGGAPGSSSNGTAATTTRPRAPTSSTTTTIPSDVYTNLQPEPWNPSPCTIGQPATTTTTAHKTAEKK